MKWQTLIARLGSTLACDLEREDEERMEKPGGLVVHLKVKWREKFVL